MRNFDTKQFELILDYEGFKVYQEKSSGKFFYVDETESYEVFLVARLVYDINHDIKVSDNASLEVLFDNVCCGEYVHDTGIEYLWFNINTNKKGGNMTYQCKEKIQLKRSDFERIKKLFQVDMDDIEQNGELTQHMEQLVDEVDYREDTIPYSFSWSFDNNKTITMDICCGRSNAYDDCMLWDGKEDKYLFDCDYDIRESIEFVYERNSYICEFEIIED